MAAQALGASADIGRAGARIAPDLLDPSLARIATEGAGAVDPALYRSVSASQNAADIRRLRGLDDAAGGVRGVDDATGGVRGADDLGDAAGDGAKAKKSSFLADNAITLLATGVAAGGLYYLEQKYDKAKEETKNCMKVCLPENWDDHAYGDLQKSDLIYKEIPDAGDQPVCTESIPDCGKYCGDKCEEIHDYDAPGSGLLGGLAGDVGEGAGGLLGGLFGGLFEGLGIDESTAMIGSGASFICCCMLIIMMILLR